MFYKILIQPSKSDRSQCKNCLQLIEKNSLRVKVVDAREFNAFIKKEGRQNLTGQGLSRGYFESVGPKGEHISIKKYFVHLDCYQPIQPHPFERQYFDLKGFRPQHKELFDDWLRRMNNPIKSEMEEKQKPKPMKRSNPKPQLTKSAKKTKTKAITKKQSKKLKKSR